MHEGQLVRRRDAKKRLVLLHGTSRYEKSPKKLGLHFTSMCYSRSSHSFVNNAMFWSLVLRVVRCNERQHRTLFRGVSHFDMRVTLRLSSPSSIVTQVYAREQYGHFA